MRTLILLLLLLANSASGATRTWTGTTGTLWSAASNWGGIAPVAGDDLVFPPGASHMSNTNDFPGGTAFNSITVTGSPYVLSGNLILLGAGGISSNPGLSGDTRILVPLTLAAPTTFSVTTGVLKLGDFLAAAPIDLNGMTLTLHCIGDKFVFNGGIGTMDDDVIGSGSIIKTGPGFWVLFGDNTFTGQVQVNAGYLSAASAHALGAADDTPANGTLVNSGGTLNFGSFVFPAEHVTVNGVGQNGDGALTANTTTLTGTVVLGMNVGMSMYLSDSLTFSGRVTGSGRFGMGGVDGNKFVLANSGNDFAGGVLWGATGPNTNTLELGGDNVIPDYVTLDIPSGALFSVNSRTDTIASLSGAGTVDLGGGGKLTIQNSPPATYSGAVIGIGTTIVSGGAETWTGHSTYSGIFTHSGGVFTLNGGGTLPASFAQSAGSFNLSDSASAGILSITGGSFNPGNMGTGVANSGSVALAPGVIYQEIINGASLSSFSNLHVNGIVNLAGATLTLAGSGAGVPSGNQFVIIDNDAADPVIGTFAGLPQDAVIASGPGGFKYTISYNGGTGNDVVLTAVAPTGVPAFDPRMLIALGVALAAIALVAIRR